MVLQSATSREHGLEKRCSKAVHFSGCDRDYFLGDEIVVRARLDARYECSNLKVVNSKWKVYFGSKFLFSYANRLNTLEIHRFRLTEFGNYTVRFSFLGEVLSPLGNFNLNLTGKCQISLCPANIDIFIPGGTREVVRCPTNNQYEFKIKITNFNGEFYENSILASANLDGKKISDGVVSRNKSALIFPRAGFRCDSNSWYEFSIEWPNYETGGKLYSTFYRQFSSKTTRQIEFDCLFNCHSNVNPRFVFSLFAKCSNCFFNPQQKILDWKWSSSNIPDFEQITVKETSPNRLVLSENNTLQFGATYEVTARFGDLEAQYSFTTMPEPELRRGVCEFRKAQPGLPASVTCKDFTGPKPLYYEVYDPTNGDEDCSHLLVASHSPSLRLHPPSDRLLVRITDRYGATVNYEVKEVEKEVDTNFIEGDASKALAHIAEIVQRAGDDEQALELISSASALARSADQMNSTVVLEILDILTSVTNVSESTIKVGASILYTLGGLTSNVEYSGETRLKIYESAAWVSEQWQVLNSRTRPSLRIDTLATSKCVLRSLEAIRKIRDPLVTNPDPSEEPNELETRLSRAQISTNHFLEAIESILTTVESNNVNFGIETKISLQTIKMFVRVSCLRSKSNHSRLSSDRVFFHPKISQELGQFENVTVAECILTNVFWWDPEVNGSTDTVILKVFGYTSYSKVSLEKFELPVKIKLSKRDETMLSGYLTGVANSAPKFADEQQKIHYQQVFTFSHPPNSGGILVLKLDEDYVGKLKIKISQDHFPTYNETLMSRIGTDLLPFTVRPVLDRHTLLYVSILPASPAFDGLQFEIGYYQEECQVYRGFHFNESLCEVDRSRLAANEIFCVCHHLSTFSGNFFVAPNSPANPLDIKFIAEIKTNFYILTAVVLILIVSIVLMVYHFLRERSDTNVGTVKTLEDIYPWHRAYYLVGLTTGRAGCPNNSAKIAIRLFGTHSRSKVHVLNRNKRTVLRSGSDSWFLLLSSKSLGKIRNLQIWSDNSGWFPFLYCSTVTVIDYRTKAVVQFVCQKWISTFYAHSVYFSATPQELIHKVPTVQIFGFNVARGCRGRNRWIRLVSKYPSGDFTQYEEACLTLSLIITNMLFSIMFFGDVGEGPFDPPSSNFTLKELLISVECIIGSLLINSLALVLFSLSKKSSEFKDCVELEKLTPKWLPKIHTPRAQLINNVVNYILDSVYESVFPPKFHPATMVNLKGSHRKLMSVAAWSYAVLINTSATVLIILYGVEYGRNRSIIWLKTLVMSLIEDATFIIPLKVFCTSMIASFIFQGSTSKTISLGYIGVDKPRTYKEKVEILKSSLKLRSDPIYTGSDNLSIDYSKIWMAKLKIFNTILFIWLLTLLLSSTITTLSAIRMQEKFTANQNARTILSHRSEHLSVPANDIKTKKEIFHFMVHTLFPAIERISWYNGEHLGVPLEQNRHRTLQYESFVVGVVRITQHRLKSDSFSQVPDIFQNIFVGSFGFLSSSNQEKNWTFPPHPTNPLEIDMKHIRNESERLFTRLFITDWLDDKTRTVLLYLPIYSLNVGLITSVKICIVQHPSGVHGVSYQAATSWLTVGWKEKVMYASITIVTIMVLTISYYSYLRFAFMGGQSYMHSWLTVLEILTIFISVSTISTWIWKIMDFYIFAKEPTEMHPDKHYSFAQMVANTDEFSINISALFLLLNVRVLTLGYRTWIVHPSDQEILEIVHDKAKLFITPTIFFAFTALLWGRQIFHRECDVNKLLILPTCTKILLFFAPKFIFALMYYHIVTRRPIISRRGDPRRVKLYRELKGTRRTHFKFPTPLEDQFANIDVKLKQLEDKFEWLSIRLNKKPTTKPRGRRKVDRQKRGAKVR